MRVIVSAGAGIVKHVGSDVPNGDDATSVPTDLIFVGVWAEGDVIQRKATDAFSGTLAHTAAASPIFQCCNFTFQCVNSLL